MNRYRKAYLDAELDGDGRSAEEWHEIEDEVKRVIEAPSARAAGKIIAWWGCWAYTGGNPTATARLIRQRFAEGGK